MTTSGMKFGFESEGPMLGRRTVFASWPDVTILNAVDAAMKQGIDSVYFCVTADWDEFVHHFIRSFLPAVVTLDFPYSQEAIMVPAGTVPRTCIKFMRAELDAVVCGPSPLWVRQDNTLFIKLVCEKAEDFDAYVDKANEFAGAGHTVLLMPDFWTLDPIVLGQVMMASFGKIHQRVRCMPPVHHILGIP